MTHKENRNLYGVTAGIGLNDRRYTADRKTYVMTNACAAGNRRAMSGPRYPFVYTQRVRGVERWAGDLGVEASLRKHVCPLSNCTSDTARRRLVSGLLKADMLMSATASVQLEEVASSPGDGRIIDQIRDVRSTAIMVKRRCTGWKWRGLTRLDRPVKLTPSRIRTVKDRRAPITNRLRRIGKRKHCASWPMAQTVGILCAAAFRK